MNVKENNIESAEFTKIIDEKYLAYALSTIMSRSLPDVRDGLKPVHRRLLYSMLQLKLDPKSGYKKCARIVGDVIGKYHPHGDVAVYEALVRLAQDFSVRYPLIDGQGNFGSIDGDNPAAMRYTESRLTHAAMSLLEDIDKDTVDFKLTYDGNDEEPILLPASFPNLLANGAEGIAVGMATTIPPHNIYELISASIALIKNPDLSIEDIMEYIPGPDLPTGGIIFEDKKNILNAYHTGKGSIRVRAKWHKEDLSYGTYQIVISEIPYQVQKSKLIEKIADLYKDKKLPLLGNIRDESAEEIRIILEPKNKTCDPQILMESLFKFTELESRINLNMNALNKDSVPCLMNLKDILLSFLNFKYLTFIKKSNYRLKQINHRLEILQALMIAYSNLDKIIEIIRYEKNAKFIIINMFSLNNNQAESILNMRLRSLQKLEEISINSELKSLNIEKATLESIIDDQEKTWKSIINELKTTKKKFDITTNLGIRKTKIEKPSILPIINDSIFTENFNEKEPITIICSKLGWIRILKGHNIEEQEIKYKETDEKRFIISAYNTDNISIFAENGKFYSLSCDKISRNKNHGDSLRFLIDLEDDIQIIDMFINQKKRKILVASENGRAFIVEEEEIIAQTKSGKQIMTLKENDRALICKIIDNEDIAIIGTNRKLVIYPIHEIPLLKKGQGVILQQYRHAKLSDIKLLSIKKGLIWSGKNIFETNLVAWKGKRGSVGRMAPNGFPKNNKF